MVPKRCSNELLKRGAFAQPCLGFQNQEQERELEFTGSSYKYLQVTGFVTRKSISWNWCHPGYR